MAQFFQKRTYQSWQEIDTETLLRGLILTKEKITDIDILNDDLL